MMKMVSQLRDQIETWCFGENVMDIKRIGLDDDDDNNNEDNEEEKDKDNNKDNKDDKGFSALGLDRDLGFFYERSEAKQLSEAKKTPKEQLAFLSPDRGMQFQYNILLKPGNVEALTATGQEKNQKLIAFINIKRSGKHKMSSNQ